MPGPRLAIVFPCHASGAQLVRRSVLALHAQTVDPALFEVVVACDGGDPHSAVRAAVESHAHPFRVKVVDSPRPRGDQPHRNHARNTGYRNSQAPLLWFMDSDFLFAPNAIEHALAEHDAALARGIPAVFSPVLKLIDMPPDAWLAASARWAHTGAAADFQAFMATVPTSGGCFAGYEGRYREGPASSERVPEILEGMPLLWRGLVDALGGFDEWFVGYGANKEMFVEHLKGLEREGMLEMRLLQGTCALHQPHPLCPSASHPERQVRWMARLAQIKDIAEGAAWWRTKVEKVKQSYAQGVRESGVSRDSSADFRPGAISQRMMQPEAACLKVGA